MFANAMHLAYASFDSFAQDLPNAMTVDTILRDLELDKIHDRPWYIQPAVATTGHGLRDAFTWLKSVLEERRDPSTGRIEVPQTGIYSTDYFMRAAVATASAPIPVDIPRKATIFNPKSIPLGQAPSEDIVRSQKEAAARDNLRMTTIAAWLERASNESSSDEEFLKQVEDYSLDSWDHYTHIRLGYVVLWKYGSVDGLDILGKLIEKFIQNSSRTNGKSYHVTMTRFWGKIIARAMYWSETSLSLEVDEKKRFVILLKEGVTAADLWDAGLFKRYYSTTLMFSAEARATMLEPDLMEMPYYPDFEARQALMKTSDIIANER
jgi:hypothetical protein